MSRNFFIVNSSCHSNHHPQTHNKLYRWKKVPLCFSFFTSKSSFGKVVWCKMLYSPNLYFFKLCKHSLYSVHTIQIPPKFFACSPPAIFHYTQEARTHQKCAKMSRNHVCHCFAWKIARPLINLGFFYLFQEWRQSTLCWKLCSAGIT